MSQQIDHMTAKTPVEIRCEKVAEYSLAEFIQLRNILPGRDVRHSVDRGIANEFTALLDRPANLFNRLRARGVSKELQERLEIDPRYRRGIGVFLAEGIESLLVSDLRQCFKGRADRHGL